MKIALLFLCIAAITLSVEGACDVSACTLGSVESCKVYNDFLGCLNQQENGCTSSFSDGLKKVAIESAKATAEAGKALIGCGADGITVSMFSLLLPVIVSIFKS